MVRYDGNWLRVGTATTIPKGEGPMVYKGPGTGVERSLPAVSGPPEATSSGCSWKALPQNLSVFALKNLRAGPR